MADYKQEKVVNYILTNSGKKFNILNPDKDMITIEDIAHSLSNLCRYTGHLDRFYSVAEHSILCANIALFGGYSEKMQMYALTHDFSESVVNDIARPIKQEIPKYKEIEDNIMKVMWEVVGIEEPTEEEYKELKKIDNTALLLEMKQLSNRDLSDYPDIESLDVDVKLDTKHVEQKDAKDTLLYIFYLLKEQLED